MSFNGSEEWISEKKGESIEREKDKERIAIWKYASKNSNVREYLFSEINFWNSNLLDNDSVKWM